MPSIGPRDGSPNVFVVARHAHAGDKRSWPDADTLRPLSQAGRQQSEGLAETLLGLMQPLRLVSSPHLRCQQTLIPLSRRSNRVVETSTLLSPDAEPRSLARYLTHPPADLSVYCTHGETLKALLGHWEDEGGVRLLADGRPVDSNRTEKGGAWLILDDEPRVAHYLRPLHIGPALVGT